METAHLLGRYGAVALGVLGGLEWLLGRTVSRMAAAPNLDGTPRTIVETIGRMGLDLIAPSFLLALMLLYLFALTFGAEAVRGEKRLGLITVLMLAVFGAVVGAASVLPATPWLAIVFNLLSLSTMLLLALLCLRDAKFSSLYKAGVALSVLGYLGWFVYVLGEGFSVQGREAGGSLLILNIGEMLLVAVPFLFFLAIAVPHKQWLHPLRWLLPILVVALFSAANVADMVFDQGFTGVFSLWSVGYTLFLPWPLYALALGAFLYVILTCFTGAGAKVKEANPNTGLALLFLLFAGYNLQLTYQHLLAVVALTLLAGVGRPFEVREGRRVGEKRVDAGGGESAAADGKITI